MNISLWNETFISRGIPSSALLNIWYKQPPNNNARLFGQLRKDTAEWMFHNTARRSYLLENSVRHFTPRGGGPMLPVPDGLTVDNDTPLIVEFFPEPPVPEEQNIMLQVLREYLPHRGDDMDGWIPFALEDRVKRYPKAFVELFKYMDKARQPRVRELLAEQGLTPVER